jgi:F0F1-type ATP synthase assembly protein I
MSAQMGVTIFLGSYFGKMLDEKYSLEKKWFTMALTLLSVIIALYFVIKQLNKINNADKK